MASCTVMEIDESVSKLHIYQMLFITHLKPIYERKCVCKKWNRKITKQTSRRQLRRRFVKSPLKWKLVIQNVV